VEEIEILGWIHETGSKDGPTLKEGFTKRLFRDPIRMPTEDMTLTNNANSKLARTTNVEKDEIQTTRPPLAGRSQSL